MIIITETCKLFMYKTILSDDRGYVVTTVQLILRKLECAAQRQIHHR